MNGPSFFTQETNDHLYVAQTATDDGSAVWLSDQMRVAVRHDRSGLAWVLAMRRVLFDVEQRIEAQLHAASIAAEEQAGREVNARFENLNGTPFGTRSHATTVQPIRVSACGCDCQQSCDTCQPSGDAA